MQVYTSMAYIMDKYGMGISLSKSNGTKLEAVNAQQNPDGIYSTYVIKITTMTADCGTESWGTPESGSSALGGGSGSAEEAKPTAAPFPEDDRRQLVTGWPSGYGVRELGARL